MKTDQSNWIKYLAAAAATIALPLAVMAHEPAGDARENCQRLPPAASPMALPPPGIHPAGMPPAMPPYLHDIELTEAQQDRLFALMHEQAPLEREKMKAAFKAMEELHRLAESDHFDVAKARLLAETHAQALGQMVMMHVELDAKVRAFLTPEQRKQLDEARAKAESRHGFKRS